MHFSAVTGDVRRVLFVIVSLPDYLGGYETYGYEVNIEHIPGIFESTTSLLYPKVVSSGETASDQYIEVHAPKLLKTQVIKGATSLALAKPYSKTGHHHLQLKVNSKSLIQYLDHH